MVRVSGKSEYRRLDVGTAHVSWNGGVAALVSAECYM